MAIAVSPMTASDWTAISTIYREGIDTGNATFEAEPTTSWEAWSKSKVDGCSLVAREGERVIGWAALSHVSPRRVYAGVAEVSVYVQAGARGRGVGSALMEALIAASEARGIWTLQAGIFPENRSSLQLHQKHGFRRVGIRERLGRMTFGPYRGRWRDVVLLERRSTVAGDTHLKQAIEVGLDEALTALKESFYDLTDEQAARFPIPGRNNVAWIVMHCLDNLDDCAVGAQGGQRLLPADDSRWDLWECGPEERPKPGDPFPTVGEMLDLLRRVRRTAERALAGADEPALVAHTMSHPAKPTRSDFYMHTIYHTMAHIRQIWLLRGALGLVDGAAWPRQHWA